MHTKAPCVCGSTEGAHISLYHRRSVCVCGGGHIRRQFQTVSRGGGGCRTIATSDQSGGRCMTLEFKFMCCLQRDAHKETMRGTGSVTGENDMTGEGWGGSRKCRGWDLKKSARRWVIWSDRVTVSEANGVHKGMPVEWHIRHPSQRGLLSIQLRDR